MELIKRKILLENSVDRNYNSPTYGTVTATSFYINVMITQDIDDMGMFTDMYYIPNLSFNLAPIDSELRITGKTQLDYYNYTNKVLTATTDSKLEDVRSYSNSNQYILNFDMSHEEYLNYKNEPVDGVDRITALDSSGHTYVFGTDKNDPNIGNPQQKSGLLYRNNNANNESVVSYIGEGWNETNVSLSAITKEEYLFGIISKPEIKSDVFIDRGITTIFEKHLKLSEITNIEELTRYGRGFYSVNKQ